MIIEFIYGQTLFNIHDINFSWEDKIVIIFQLLIAFQYIHYNNFVYRDLKPANVIFNEKNKMITVIDFDRMIDIRKEKNKEHTIDLTDTFLDSGVNQGIISDKIDICSLGKMIDFLNKMDQIKNKELVSICNRCIKKNPNERPSISDLIVEIYFLFNSYIDKSFLKKLPLVQFLQKVFSYKNESEIKIICKLIHFFSLASNKNNSKAQYKIGLIFLRGKFIERNINQSIHYLKLSANQNNTKAQIKLIQIYNKMHNFYQFNLNQNQCNEMKTIEYLFKNNNNNHDYFKNYLFDFQISDEIHQNIKKSNILIIDYYSKYSCFIVSFEQTILLLNNSLLRYLFTLFLSIQKVSICFLNNKSKKIFDKNIKIEYFEILKDQQFEKEIKILNQELFNNQNQINNFKLLNKIKTCISSYLIKESYYKLPIDRINTFNYENKEYKCRVFKKNEYVILTNISNSNTFLIYILSEKKLAVLKKQKFNENNVKTYLSVKHQYLPKYYGNTEDQECAIFEYIKGKSLAKFKEFNFSKIEKVTIIFQIVSIIRYIHEHHFIYRYLNPNNIIIDENNDIALINFDRHIIGGKHKESPKFIAPETKEKGGKNITIKSDVYSLGEIIYYIINESYKNYQEFKTIYERCINKDPVKRIDSTDLIHEIFKIMLEQKIPLNENDSEILYNYGYYIHYEPDLNHRDLNKIIDYYLRGSNKFHMIARYNFAELYSENLYIPRDIYIAIKYYKLAVDLNDTVSAYKLGLIYYEGEYIDRDINRSIELFEWAADHNDPDAQIKLAFIYYEGKYVDPDSNKSIEYLKRAANQNNPEAQYHLGKIYLEGKYIEKDITKSLNYYHLAAGQNHKIAQFELGKIYFEGKLVQKDIHKGIYFIEQSSNNEHKEAMFYMAYLYITRDNEKSKKLYKETSTIIERESKNNLGVIYINEIANAKVYFNEAIKKNDKVSMYNLALINYINNVCFDESIQNLIQSSELNFDHSTEFLCLILIKKFENILFECTHNSTKNNTKSDLIHVYLTFVNKFKDKFIKIAQKELSKYAKDIDNMTSKFLNIIDSRNLTNQKVFEKVYQKQKSFFYLYNGLFEIVPFKPMTANNITESFLKGFIE